VAYESEIEIKNRIQLVLDSAPMCVTIYDATRKMIDCNLEAVRLFKFLSKEQFLGEFNKRFFDFFTPNQPCGTPSKIKVDWLFEQMNSKGQVQLEWMHLDINGEEIPTEVTFIRIDYKDTYNQDTFMFVCYVSDLREVKEAKKQEQKASEMTNALFEASPLCLEIWERLDDGVIKLIECNNQVLNVFGVSSKKEYIEQHFDLTPTYQPCGTLSKIHAQEALDRVFRDGHAKFEYMHLTANGEELPVEFTYVRMNRSDKQLIVGYAYDLRQVKAAEKLRTELAEETNKTKNQFLARMSHEIRTPITSVLGISEIELHSKNLTPHAEEAFAKIHNSANSLLSIVNDILDFSKIEAGKLEIISEEYETASMVSDVAQMQVVFLGSKDIKFEMDIDENLPYMLTGDMLRIQQILNNLLSNSFKYTHSGTVTLSIKYDRQHLHISVRDTGIGMTEEQLNTLYEDFTRFHEQQLRHIGGTGLGMSIVYNLVDLMEGYIDIRSKINEGTEVSVLIPQKPASDITLGKDLTKSLQEFEMFSSTTSKNFRFEPEPMPYGKVLVVDDMDANLYVAKGLLNFYSLNIETCTSGYEAIEKVRQGKIYDIIFLDQMMPSMDGTETLQHLRELGYTQPIVALTANALIGQAEEFIKNGFNGFVSKPIQTAHLNAILVKHIKDRQSAEVIETAKLSKKETAKGNIHDFQSDSDLIEKLRIDFAKNHKSTCTNIREALYYGDMKTAHRLAHSLKGLAGLIHESGLSQTAERVEQVLKDEVRADEALLSLL